MGENLVHGLTALGNGPAVAYLIAGSLIGMFLGVIPGLGGVVVLTVVLAFIYHIDLTGTLCLFLATQAGSYFSASITSILLNTPAHPEAFAVTLDGFPMAQRGEAGRALGLSACCTCIGGLIGCAVLVGFYQIFHFLPLAFHPPELVALILIALVLVGTLGTDAMSKALISAALGLLIGSVGPDPVNGVTRYNFGSIGLLGGVSLVALFLGLFAIPQMALVFGTASTVARQDMMGRAVANTSAVRLEKGFGPQVIGGVLEALHHWVAIIRAALIGVVTGVIPGIGGFAANFMSYGIAQQTSRKKRTLFGTGIPEGIIAAEGSSLAKEAGGMVPVLGLGIPGGVGNALFLAALDIKGIKVGYGFLQTSPSIAYEIVWIIALGGLVGTVAGLLIAPQLAKITRVPGPGLVPFVMAIAVIGIFVADNQFFSVVEITVFAIVGFILRRLRFSLAAFGVAFILGPTLEDNIYQTHAISPGISFLKAPFADVLLALLLTILVLKGIQLRRESKEREAAYQALTSEETNGRKPHRPAPYPLLSLITDVVLIGIATFALIYAIKNYKFIDLVLPFAASAIVALVAVWRFPFEVRNYLLSRKSKGRNESPLQPAPPQVGAPEPELGGLIFAAEVPRSAVTSELVVSSLVVDDAWGRHGQYTRETAAFLWMGALVLLCFLVGFTIGPPTFCVVYGLTSTHSFLTTWAKRAIFAFASAAVIWAIAYEMLNVLHLSYTSVINF